MFILNAETLPANAQRAYPGRGAISAQDIAQYRAQHSARMAASADADQVCARSATGAVVPAPSELKSQNGVLEVTFKFLTATDAQGLVRYCYVTDTGLQSPTLRVNPGDTLIIHFQNDLPAAAASSAKDNMAGMNMTLAADASSANAACNGVMSASASNIHFHGMNVPPVCGQDEVVHTLVAPGQSFDYKVQIPANEPPGLYWYHPHPHGISEGQVQGGATGALIVEGLQSVDPALAGLTERTFVLRDQLLTASEANDANIPAWDVSINYVPVTYPAYTPAVIATNPGQQELWRVANTAADTIMKLEYLVNGTAQTMQVVAIDGYPIAAGSSGQASVGETSILLPPGSRAEFVVTTPNIGDQAQLVTQYWNTGPDGDFDPTRTLATIVSQNGAEPASAAATKSSAQTSPLKITPRKVKRFAALAQATPVAQRNLYFSEVLQNPTDPNSPTTFFITEQGQAPAAFTMDQAPNIVVHAGTVEDWVIENHATEDHIFHIHQIHFQVLEANGVAINDPAVRDTVDLPYWTGTGPYPSVKLRMDFRDTNIIGTFVYHCHILQHEDSGMMAEIQVLPAGSASLTTAAASATSLTPNGNITLTANVVDAATGNPTPTGLVQFQLNGVNVGAPTALAAGQATLTTTLNGDAGAGNLTAFYQGDSTYTESQSAAIPITLSAFALSSSGTTATVGSAAIATVAVNVANNYTSPIALTCAMPSTLTESACFVNPTSATGTGKVSLTVNTTPSHPLSSRNSAPGWFAASGGLSLAGLLFLFLPRRRWRGIALLGIAFLAATFSVLGCGGAAKIDPGTAKGSYTVVVTGTAGSGAAQYQTGVDVPINIQ
ncbi:Multicopper oxidase [Acidisarcina polymorpha]|uniref:Multicopper oxidase n=1 Tax=Acidisarcina polymorpha TaxID=2211140 RepID=A0A2Z5G238_9BACT|nr:Multicopper oxidase [Acidisarcina polymorpha]